MDDRHAPQLYSLLSSPTFRRHSGSSLCCIDSLGPFQLSPADAAAFPHLRCLGRLAVDGVMAACLPSGLKKLTFEGRGWDMDTLSASVLSHLKHLGQLDVYYLSVARLPHSIGGMDLVGCEPGEEFAAALKAAQGVVENDKDAMWRDDSQLCFDRELLYGHVFRAWDKQGRLAIDDAKS